jgi:hypothetical protein
MKLKRNIINLFLATALLAFSGCETMDLDQNEDPSALQSSYLDPIYTFNYAQLQLPDFVDSANSFAQRVTRQMAMTGGNTYNNAFAPVNFDANWTSGYLILNAIKVMEPKATEMNETFILGASKVIRCYVLMTMVDMYGNIPYSEALQGNGNLSPKFDDSEDVYAGIYGELNQAIALLEQNNTTQARDLYYGGTEGNPNAPAWVTLAKTLKLKMLNTARLAPGGTFGTYNIQSEVNSLLTEDDLIGSASNPDSDFVFRYGTERDLPNSRHPQYNASYEFGGAPYLGNYFMWAVSTEKGAGVNDPREDYYFFRQVSAISGNTVTSQTVPCLFSVTRPDHYNDDEYDSFYDPAIDAPYCTVDSNLYLGRDHGDWSGIPADDGLRTVVGLYPAGGAIGAPFEVVDTGGEKGALGQGIMPIVLSSFVHFMKAELILTGVAGSGNARAELEAGIRTSIEKVTTFLPQQPGEPSDADVATETDAYVTFVLGRYDSAAADAKLQIIIKEFYIASWGNGIEPYNNYRRTGYPDNFQPTLEQESGPFFYTALYPGVSVNNNLNAPNNVRTKKVFWDAGLTLH